MPTDNMEEANSEEQGSGSPLVIIIIVALVLIIILGGLAVFLLGGDDEEQVKQPLAQVQNQVQPRSSTKRSDLAPSRPLSEIGILYPLDTFTVNLKSDQGRRYLKVTMSLELNGEELSLELDSKSPVIRDRVIRILTSKTLEEITSKKGKQKVSNQIMNTLNSMIRDGNIQGIYFTEFVIQ
jgi:flagellar FliL protein